MSGIFHVGLDRFRVGERGEVFKLKPHLYAILSSIRLDGGKCRWTKCEDMQDQLDFREIK
jgi:hypothetical protein